MLDIIEDYLETVNVFKGSDVSLGDLEYVDEATAEFLLYKFKRELKRLPQFLEIAKKNKKGIMNGWYEEKQRYFTCRLSWLYE